MTEQQQDLMNEITIMHQAFEATLKEALHTQNHTWEEQIVSNAFKQLNSFMERINKMDCEDLNDYQAMIDLWYFAHYDVDDAQRNIDNRLPLIEHNELEKREREIRDGLNRVLGHTTE